MDLSVVIPLYNEEESLPELLPWLERVMTAQGYEYEIVLIDDGSYDGSWDFITSYASERVVAYKFRRNYGKSAGLNVGFEKAKGNVIITMDADLQDSPDEIPDLYNMIAKEGYDLVSGWKQKRNDPLEKRIPSKLYNAVVRGVSGIQLHDFNCGLKAYKNNVAKSVDVFGEMHRYIPVIAEKSGFKKIGEKVVQHYPRKYGYSKYGFERYINGFLDLMTIMFISKFGKRPMHLFGLIGVLFFLSGFLILGYLAVLKMIYSVGNINDRPLFFLGILTIILGTQFFLAGFIAEMISRNSPYRNHYEIEKTKL